MRDVRNQSSTNGGSRPAPQNYVSRRRAETLDYLRSMLGQLRTMAEAERADMLAYLIEMAYVEVSDIIRGERPLRLADQPGNSAHKRDSAA
jgi:hypothetical protein